MLGRVAAVIVLSSVALSNTLPGQCDYQPVASFQFRSSYLDIAADQLDIVAANGYGLALYAVTSGAPRLTATLPLPGVTRVVRSYNGNAFVGSGTSVFFILKTRPPIEAPSTGIAVGGSVDTGSQVNDLLPAASRLFAATANGLQQYNIIDPARPARTPVTFATSGTIITSLAQDGETLYVADSDSTVEVFSIADPSNPQKVGTLASLPRVTSVKVDRNRLYSSDGVQTDVFFLTGQTAAKVGTLPFGISAFATIGGDIAAAAGNDRRLHIYDLALAAAPVELFATDLLPSGGTINRVAALAAVSGKLYVAAGDIGLAAFDLSSFRAPYPLRSYATGSTSSVVSTGERIYAAGGDAGLIEFNQASSGELTSLRHWDDRKNVVQDANGGFLLTSSGSALTDWTLVSATPVPISTASFSAPIQSAIISGSTAYAVLDNQTLWSIDVSQATPAPRAVTTSAQHPSFIARSGSSIAIADVRDDGSTTILNFPDGNLQQQPRTVTIAGLATALAHSGSLAAVFTFRGISVADLATGAVTTMAQSNTAVASSLALDGTRALAITANALAVWDARTGTFIRTIPLPSAPVSIDVPETPNGFAAVATADGVTSVAYTATSQLPTMLPLPNGNAYYRKVLAAARRLYLFDGRGIDVFETAAGFTPHYLTRINPPGAFDVAVSDRGLFALASNGTVFAYGADGTLLAQRNVTEGLADTSALSIAAAAGVPWVSVSQQCRTGDCQKNTLIVDPQSLVFTSTMTGGITAVVTAGTRAYAITTLPSEARVINVADPLHPSVLMSRPTEGTNPPVSIAYGAGTVYVLGERLYAYSESTLLKSGEQAVAFDPATYADQHIAISGSCAVVTGRTATPELYSVPALTASTGFGAPAAVRSLASAGNNVYLLTDDSLEIWSSGSAPPAPRRRAVR